MSQDDADERARSQLAQPQWRWLAERPHRWRRQPWIKGRKLTVGDVVGRLNFEQLTPEALAADMDLPIEAVREAAEWASIPANADLIAMEDAEDAMAADRAAPARLAWGERKPRKE